MTCVLGSDRVASGVWNCNSTSMSAGLPLICLWLVFFHIKLKYWPKFLVYLRIAKNPAASVSPPASPPAAFKVFSVLLTVRNTNFGLNFSLAYFSYNTQHNQVWYTQNGCSDGLFDSLVRRILIVLVLVCVPSSLCVCLCGSIALLLVSWLLWAFYIYYIHNKSKDFIYTKFLRIGSGNGEKRVWQVK